MRGLRAVGCIIVLALGALLCSYGLAQADVTVAQVRGPADLAARHGLVVYSDYNPTTRRYELMQVADGITSRLPVPSSSGPFDPSIGPTPNGRPLIVYQRCDAFVRDCDIYAYDRAVGHEHRVSVSTPGRSEHAPAYWRGTLAFARLYGPNDAGHDIVYVRTLGHPGRVRRAPGLPTRRCLGKRCIPVYGAIKDLALHGSSLAETASSFVPVDDGGSVLQLYETVELRLVDIVSGRSQQLAVRGTGNSGQSWIGPSIQGRYLFATFTCLGEPGGCATRAGIYRYDLTSHMWALSHSATPILDSQVTDTGTYELPRCANDDPGNLDPNPACPLIKRIPAPRYRATRPPPTGY